MVWSGDSSRSVAEELSVWLQRVIQAVKPFYSPEIEKGAKWSSEIDEALENTRFGIVCLTPDNLDSTWIHYEAGALSKTGDASICTFLVGLSTADVRPPLGKYQHTLAKREDVLKLVKTINHKLGEVGHEPLETGLLKEIFDDAWPKLEGKLAEITKSIASAPSVGKDANEDPYRSDRELLTEILDLLRTRGRSIELSDALEDLRLKGFIARETFGDNPSKSQQIEHKKTSGYGIDIFFTPDVTTSEIDVTETEAAKFFADSIFRLIASAVGEPVIMVKFNKRITFRQIDRFIDSVRIFHDKISEWRWHSSREFLGE